MRGYSWNFGYYVTTQACYYRKLNRITHVITNAITTVKIHSCNSTNKIQIKQAVEAVFNVKVESVNTINVKPKKKRVGRYVGKTSQVKKAIVKLKEGSSIEL